MTPQERLIKQMDALYDERSGVRSNTKEYAQLTGELRGLAYAVVECSRMSMDDLALFIQARADARVAGERQPQLLTWLAHRGVPSPRTSQESISA